MQLPIYQVDAFTDMLFGGNYAAVVPLADWLPAELMQAVAAENNLSETAFVVRQADGGYAIRWFSPLAEIDFCGHATLAAAFVLFRLNPDVPVLRFRAAAVGELSLSREDDGLIHMDAPRLAPEPVAEPPALLFDGLSIRPDAVLVSRQAWFAVYADEGQVRAVEQDPELIRQLAPRDVVVTAPGHDVDFVSRYFWPANGGLEDMVTGSIHAGLAPYWAERLGRSAFSAHQASARGADFACSIEGDRVLLGGQCRTVVEGLFRLP